MELSPAYADASIRRWQRVSGQQATLGGRPYAAVAAGRGVTPAPSDDAASTDVLRDALA